MRLHNHMPAELALVGELRGFPSTPFLLKEMYMSSWDQSAILTLSQEGKLSVLLFRLNFLWSLIGLWQAGLLLSMWVFPS